MSSYCVLGVGKKVTNSTFWGKKYEIQINIETIRTCIRTKKGIYGFQIFLEINLNSPPPPILFLTFYHGKKYSVLFPILLGLKTNFEYFEKYQFNSHFDTNIQIYKKVRSRMPSIIQKLKELKLKRL